MINFTLVLKGILFGMANLIPGISGGSVALITKVYKELIQAIDKVIKAAFSIFYFNFKPLKKIPYKFITIYALGIISGLAIFILLSQALLGELRAGFYSFLIAAILYASYILQKPLQHTLKNWFLGILGAIISLAVFYFSLDTNPSVALYFFLGILAISTLILPGVSGAFVLLVFGQYENFLNMLRNIPDNILLLTTFGIGGILGLITTTKILNQVLTKYPNKTLFFLIGLMIGGVIAPVNEVIQAIQQDNQIIQAIIGFAIGLLLVYTYDA